MRGKQVSPPVPFPQSGVAESLGSSRNESGLSRDVRNLKLLIEYDGAEFSGWQQQRGLRTVEGELRRALENLTGRDEVIYGAGRTDAGAHAEGQVANFRYSGPLAPDRVAGRPQRRPPLGGAGVRGE